MTACASIDWLMAGAAMPWPVAVPFRMRPNLERLTQGEDGLLLRDAVFDAYCRTRARLLATAPGRVQVGVPHPGVLEAIAAVQRRCLAHGRVEGTDTRVTAESVALGMQEDFVILRADPDAFRSEFLSVAFPSRWDPRDILEQDFAAIHAPVADNAQLLAAAPAFMRLAFAREMMLRHVWLIVPSAALDQHPEANLAGWQAALADPAPLLPRLFFRVERQTTWPLPALGRAVFLIRILMARLHEVLVVQKPRALALAAALRSMSPAVAAYRGMTEALPRLLAELDEVAA
ncbi:MAG: heme-dependent oxidative N-demethylase subunit alpha family protein [Casimicrobiaceae bacterium]